VATDTGAVPWNVPNKTISDIHGSLFLLTSTVFANDTSTTVNRNFKRGYSSISSGSYTLARNYTVGSALFGIRIIF
jgi:hypothetical protein